MKFEELLKIAEILRSPKGCPWDREQTISSMLEHLEEEFNEVKEEIVQKDYLKLREELGDLLFQIVGIMQIAKEDKLFTAENVIEDVHNKIVRRHTWVFGEDKVKNSQEASELWKKNKLKE